MFGNADMLTAWLRESMVVLCPAWTGVVNGPERLQIEMDVERFLTKPLRCA
jgi:hypothetical protein